MKTKRRKKAHKSWQDRCADRRWQKLRTERMIMDNWTCQECFTESHDLLNVHHRFYKKGAEPWEYELCELLTLCEPCHWKTEERLDAIKKAAGMGDRLFQERILYAIDKLKLEAPTTATFKPVPTRPLPDGDKILTLQEATTGFEALRAMMGRCR